MSNARPRNPQPGHLHEILTRLSGVRTSGNGYSAQCPAHPDKNPSLSIRLGDDGKVLVHCFAHCAPEAIVQAIGLTMTDLAGQAIGVGRPPTPTAKTKANPNWRDLRAAADSVAKKNAATVEDLHEYHDANGDTSFAVVRLRTARGKSFRPLHRRDGRWHIGDPKGLLPLYRLPHLVGKDEVLVVEGERCAEAAASLGFAATTSAHGACSAGKSDWTPIAAKRVIIWPDADEPGQGYARDVVAALRAINSAVDIGLVLLPDLGVGEDIVDWRKRLIAAGLAEDEISEQLALLMERSEPWPEASSTYFAFSTGPDETSASWPEPRPISNPSPPLAFPIADAFPASCARLRDYIQAVAEAFQVPEDLPALLALATFGLAQSRTVEVAPLPDWREPLAIYVLVLLPSGERKSPVFSRMVAPIRDWQRQRQMSLALGIAAAENDIKIVRERLNRKRKSAAHGKTEDAGDSLEDLTRELAELEANKPRVPSLVATEATTEAIGDLLAENDERGMLAAAEGDALDVMLGRYSQGKPNFSFWLSGHAGDTIEIRRKARPTLRLRRPALTVALAVQEEAIADLMSSRAAAGRGVLARFFFARPPSKLGYRDLQPTPVPTTLSDWYGARLHQLLDRLVPEEPAALGLSPDADELFLEFRRHVEMELRAGGSLSDHAAWGAKLAGAIARIAGVLHGIGHPSLRDATIDEETMRAALAWAPYLESHERDVAWIAGDNSTSKVAERILTWIRRERLTGFTHNEAYNAVRSPLVQKSKDIEEPLALLQELGWIRPKDESVERRTRGRPPSQRYEVSPHLSSAGDGSAPHNSRNTQYSMESGGDAHCERSADEEGRP